MKTICPICGFDVEVLDEKIRKRGRNVTCPRCEHTYFVERSAYSDLDRIEDSASLEVVPEMEVEVERFQEDEEKTEPMRRGTDPPVGKVPLKSRVFAFFASIIIGGIGVVSLIYEKDFSDIRSIVIIGLAVVVLVEYVFGKGDALKDLRKSKKPERNEGFSDFNISLEIIKKTFAIIFLVGCGIFVLIIVILLFL